MSGYFNEGLNREKIDFYHIKGIMEELLVILIFLAAAALIYLWYSVAREFARIAAISAGVKRATFSAQYATFS